MRCKACNVVLDKVEVHDDMCRSCIGKSRSVFIYTRDKTYEHEAICEKELLSVDRQGDIG